MNNDFLQRNDDVVRNNDDVMNTIDITPKDDVNIEEQQTTDNPVIIIENDENAAMGGDNNSGSRRKNWLKAVFALALVAVALIVATAAWRYYRHNYYVGMPVSCSPSQNIKKLQKLGKKALQPNVFFTQDSIGSVALNMYELRDLQASLSFEEPDSADTDVFFYSRCADYDKKGNIIGSMVIDGEVIRQDRSRLGYCAMYGRNTVIGIARSEAVFDFVKEKGGSMFRQFILVSDGEIPRVFHLHKKVERRALARMDDQLYYIESRHPETMWDFADAIRRYGFIDAIYITGGDAPSFYRTTDGSLHGIGNPAKAPSKRNKQYAPWIVFKTI